MRIQLLVVAVLGTVAASAGPLRAQAPRLERSEPGALMVDERSGTTTVRLLGEHTTDSDIRWTSRLFRYYVRRAGERQWRRLFLNPQGDWFEDRKDLAPLLANGEIVGWAQGQQTVELPNKVYLRAPGALEFRVEKGQWREWVVGDPDDDDAEFHSAYDVKAESNVLRVPIRPAPQAAPSVTAIEPAHVPVLDKGVARAVITVRAENLRPDATATVGPHPCVLVSLDALAGRLRCEVPAELQAKPGMYLVGVSTGRGGPRQLGRLTVQAPLVLARPDPSHILAADTGGVIVLGYQGGTPLGARVRAAGGAWASGTVEPDGSRAVRVRVPPALTRRAGTVELELRNAAGVAETRVLVCGGDGEQPRACPHSVTAAARMPPSARDPASVQPLPRPPAQRAPVVSDPLNAVSLRPQPEPPGLQALPLAAGATLRLADGNTLAWRRIEGSDRLVLLDEAGKVVRVFDAAATPARDRTGTLFVRVPEGVVPLGRAGRSP